MKKEILFPKAEKTLVEYKKSFCFGKTPKSAFWDGGDNTKYAQARVTKQKAEYYDIIVQKVIAARII